jgi:hypothetical protein
MTVCEDSLLDSVSYTLGPDLKDVYRVLWPE